MTLITTDSILRSADDARLAFSILNNAGCGFDPSDEPVATWRRVRGAATTDDVSVYTDTDGAGDEWVYLVGTDGSGREPWAVRVGAVGVEY